MIEFGLGIGENPWLFQNFLLTLHLEIRNQSAIQKSDTNENLIWLFSHKPYFNNTNKLFITMEKEVIIAPASEVDVVENFLNENYEFRVNVISDKTEYRKLKVEGGVEDCFRPCTDPALNTIVISARKELAEEVGNPRTLIKELIHSELVKLYDPLKDYVENLPEWDGTDRVVELFGRVPGISGKQIAWLHVWALSMMAHWLHLDTMHGNEGVPLFISRHQGAGKTTFLNRLLPPRLQNYFLCNINLANKFDKEMALTNNLLVNLDEFDKYKPSQQAEIKQLLSCSKVIGRPIYGSVQRERDRYASFCATTNDLHPLQDPSGSRRFICVEIPCGQYIDNTLDIDYDQLYAQLYHELIIDHRRYWFNNDEVRDIEMANNRFYKIADIEDMIDDCLRKPKDGEKVSPLSIKQIVEIFKSEYPHLTVNHSFKIQLGRHLGQSGFQSKISRGSTLYFAVNTKVA